MKKTLALVLVLILAVSIFAGCTKAADQPSTTPPQENASGNQDNPAAGISHAKIAAEATDAEGTFISRIDENSVEIQMTPEDSLAFLITDVADQLEGIKDGDKVKFDYKQTAEGLFVISKIAKVE